MSVKLKGLYNERIIELSASCHDTLKDCSPDRLFCNARPIPHQTDFKEAKKGDRQEPPYSQSIEKV